jgi:hypothetical protein
MNIGDSMQDVSRSGPEDGTGPGAVGHGDGHQARSLRTHKPLQDIQDLIDKLAAVTQQLRHPSRGSDRVPDSHALGREVPQQPCAVGGAERRRAEQREGADVAGHVGLALQVDTAG